jgi:hypothetical protein
MPPPGDATSQRRLALIVASSEYHDSTLQRLRAPGHDAEALADVLRDPAIGAFDVRTLLNLPSNELLRGIAEYCADSRPTDLLLLYFSCHGILDDRGRLYYATVNTERRLLAATAVSALWLNDQLEDCPARQQLLVLDCCHSGAFAKGTKGDASLALQDRFGSRGRVVLTASRATEYSFEGDQILGQGISSVFTAALVQGLRTGDADRDKDGLITVTELYDHVYERTRVGEARQTPALWTYGAEGNVLVARSPRGAVITPVALPDDLRATLDSPRPRVRESGVAELADLLDGAEPGLALTAQQRLERVAEDDIPRVAALARAALGAEPGHAAEEVRKAIEERTRRSMEEQARRGAEEQARRNTEAERRVHPLPVVGEGTTLTESSPLEDAEQVQTPSRRAVRILLHHHTVTLATIVGMGIGGVVVLVAYLISARPVEATIMSHLPNDLRASCTADADQHATCHLTDGTVVFFRLFDTAAEANADVINGHEMAPDSNPCPPPAPSVNTSVVCRYSVGPEKGLAMFSYTAKDPQRFYTSRWVPEAEPLLRGEMSTTNANPQDWTTLEANWTRLAGTR